MYSIYYQHSFWKLQFYFTFTIGKLLQSQQLNCLQGISGSQPGADPLEKVLAMIPPPPIRDSNSDEQDDADAEWED